MEPSSIVRVCQRALAALLVAGLAVGLPVGAVEPPAQKPQGTFRGEVEVREVLVEVVVTDRSGRPVTDLGPEDFAVEEDGRPVAVTSATFEPRAAPAPPPEKLAAPTRPIRVPLAAEPRDRYFILFFHDIRRGDKETLGVLSQQLRAGRDARRWVEQDLGSRDFVAVVGYDWKLELHQDFTHDRDAIARAIDRAVSRAKPLARGPSPRGGTSLFAALPEGRLLRDESPDVKASLRLVARSASRLPGRKYLFFFSIGLGLTGSERGLLDRHPKPTTFEVLNDTDVAVYSFDLTPPKADHTLASTMGGIAAATGGRYFQHVENFAKPLHEVTEQLSGVYLLSYRTDLPRQGAGYRSIDVRVRRPGLRVDYRRGFIFGDPAN